MKISPSMLACDFTRIGEEAEAMRLAGADMLHLDVMDGLFVPNISFGIPVISALRRVCNMYFDTHLMISDPLKYIGDFAKAGSNMITFHVESDSPASETIAKIKSLGVHAGISVKPGTPVEALRPFLPDIDMVLIMTVEPGFGGQSFMRDMLPKLGELCRMRGDLGLDFDIQVDGGIDITTAPLVTAHGANVLVAGSALFSQPDYKVAISALRSACNS